MVNIYATNKHNLIGLNDTYPDGKTKRLDVCKLCDRVDVVLYKDYKKLQTLSIKKVNGEN